MGFHVHCPLGLMTSQLTLQYLMVDSKMASCQILWLENKPSSLPLTTTVTDSWLLEVFKLICCVCLSLNVAE